MTMFSIPTAIPVHAPNTWLKNEFCIFFIWPIPGTQKSWKPARVIRNSSLFYFGARILRGLTIPPLTQFWKKYIACIVTFKGSIFSQTGHLQIWLYDYNQMSKRTCSKITLCPHFSPNAPDCGPAHGASAWNSLCRLTDQTFSVAVWNKTFDSCINDSPKADGSRSSMISYINKKIHKALLCGMDHINDELRYALLLCLVMRPEVKKFVQKVQKRFVSRIILTSVDVNIQLVCENFLTRWEVRL